MYTAVQQPAMHLRLSGRTLVPSKAQLVTKEQLELEDPDGMLAPHVPEHPQQELCSRPESPMRWSMTTI